MTFGHFFAILRARLWLVLAILVSTVVLTLVISLLLPKQYAATASVVADSKPDPLAAMIYGGMASPTFMATQVDVIQSDRVAQRVVRNLKLAESPEVRAQWLAATKGVGSIEVWLAEVFQKSMEVKPSRDSNVISVTYKAPDPRFAAGLANAFVQAYIETSLELRVGPAKQYSSFFDSRAKEAREAVEAAQAKVSEYQKNNGIIATDERLDVENARLNELSSQLVSLQALSSESSSRQNQASGGSADKLQEVLNNGVIGSIKADMSRAEARLQELSARLGDNHPQVIEAKASINEMRARIDAETKKISGGVGVTNSINRQREAEVKASLEAQRAQIMRMKAVRDEGMVLVRDVENAQRAYDALLARLNQSTLESQTTQSNISVLTEAIAPVEPASPRVVLNTLVSIVMGILLAVDAALPLALRDRRVRDIDDIAETLGLPVLGVVPKPTAKSLLGKTKLTSMQQRLLTANNSSSSAS